MEKDAKAVRINASVRSPSNKSANSPSISSVSIGSRTTSNIIRKSDRCSGLGSTFGPSSASRFAASAVYSPAMSLKAFRLKGSDIIVQFCPRHELLLSGLYRTGAICAFIGVALLWFDRHLQHPVALVCEQIIGGLDIVKAKMVRHQCL